MTMITRQQAVEAMLAHYDQARQQLADSNPGLFGKHLDNKARKLALKLACVVLPEGATVAYATPDDWGTGRPGYRGRTVADMLPVSA